MHLIIQGVKIVDPTSPYNNLIKDIRIHNGIIVEISDEIHTDETAQILKYPGKYISPGWFDMLASFGDPGNEQKEDMQSGSLAAISGGCTSVC